MAVPTLFANTSSLPEGDELSTEVVEYGHPDGDAAPAASAESDESTDTDGVQEPLADAVEAAEEPQATEPEADSPAPEGEQAAETEPTAPAEIDDALLSQAQRYGFSADGAKAFGNADALRQAMLALDRQAAEWGQAQLAAEQKASGGQQQQPAATQPNTQLQPAQQQQQPTGFEKFKVELDPNEFDKATIEFVNKLNDHYDTAIRQRDEHLRALTEAVLAVHSNFNQNTGQQQAEAIAREEQELDAFFAKLGDEYADVYGKEPLRHLSNESPKLAARRAFVEKMDGLKYAESKMNRQHKRSDAELMESSLNLLHPDKIKTAARKELLQKLGERRGQMVPRPNGSRAKPMTGEEKAKKNIADWIHRKGLAVMDAPAVI